MQTVIGAFENRESAQQALERLLEAGVERDEVHVEEGAAGTTGAGTTATGAGSARSEDAGHDRDRGVLESIGYFFASLFNEDRPDRGDRHGRSGLYTEAVRRGSSVVIVDAQDDEDAEEAATLLQQLGAFDVDERAQQWRSTGWTGNDQEREPAQAAVAVDLDDTQTGNKREGVMDVVQEEMQVGKRSVDRGGVRVVQRVSEQPVRELVRLREERAVVERRPVNREATAEDLSNFREGSMEIRETSEEPVVGKRARVVEEVRVGKQVHEREQAIEDTLRRKDVEVERIEGQGERTSERERALAADADEGVAATPRERDVGEEGGARKTTRKTSGKKPSGQ